MHKVIQNKINKSIIILPIFGIIILSFLYINIYVGNALMNSSAVTENHEVVVQDNNTLGIEFVDNEGNVTADPTRIEITPTADGVFNSGDVNVRVHTNSDNGYTLTMSATTTSLSGSVADSGHTIPTLLAATTEANFPNNYWGYKRTSSSIADTLYNPMVANVNIPVGTYGSTTNGEISKVNFGVKLDNLTPSDSYGISIAFAAVTNIAPNLYYMQDATSTSLAAAMPNVGDTTVLYDRRDNKEYTIAKLADGKYWMTKNLDLDGGTPLYSSDSDVPAGYDVEPYYTLPASQKITSGTTLDGGFSNDGATYAYVYNSSNKTDSCGSGCYSYYSWNAAVAGNKTNVNADVTEGDVDADAPYSICPAGWKLPTSRHDLTAAKTSSDFYQMVIHYGMNPANVNEDPDNDGMNFCTLGGDCGTNTVPRFLRAGGYYGSTFGNGGAHGLYWSSTASSSIYANSLSFSSDNVYSAYNRYRRYGFSVRCLFDATMQNFTSEDAAAMAEHQVETLVDARDGQNYTVAKLKDGKVWMTKNLGFSGTQLTPVLSDVSVDTSISWSAADNNSVCGWYSNYPCMKVSDEYGAWYNFIGATAGTVNDNNQPDQSTSSICAHGWSLPSYNDFAQINNSLTAFKASTGGRYDAGEYIQNEANNGFYWASSKSENGRYYFMKTFQGLETGKLGDGWIGNNGLFVRCLLRTE
ncbi:hypothetical protein IJ117_00385 [Candidatus Saccharibacteria bacterium]|nr:hypothetical protein [Candidatus Saccharibacteria bacterium]